MTDAIQSCVLTMLVRRSRCICLVHLVSLLAASASIAAIRPDIAERVSDPEWKSATDSAMVLTLFSVEVSQQCGMLPETKERSEAAFAAWRERNDPLVQPLLTWLEWVARSLDTTEDTMARINRIMEVYEAKATAMARAELGAESPDAAACDRALALLEDPARDLARSAQAPQLEAIRAYINELRAKS